MTGKEKWRYDAAKPMAAGVTATEGDLVFTGELTGDLLALDARTGKVLLRRALGGPAGGGVVTYNARGVQNVAIVSGFLGIYNSLAPEIGGGIPASQSSASLGNEVSGARNHPNHFVIAIQNSNENKKRGKSTHSRRC